LILSCMINEVWSDLSRIAHVFELVRHVNHYLFKDINSGCAEKVTPDFRYHSYFRTAKTRGNCLIRAFAAESKIELFAENGFSRPREDVIERCKVHVCAAHHRNQRSLGHFFSFDQSDKRRTLGMAAIQ